MSHQTTKRDCGSPSEKMLHFADVAQLDTTNKVGRALPRRPNFHQNEQSDVLACVYPHGSASIAALAGGEIEANRQVCPAIVGGSQAVPIADFALKPAACIFPP